ncbi:MAG: hypothetical protein NT086_19755 [Proteobacteria bacterium]|nr:hypothetical protein [Pseudomonadota bacterium]
MTLDELSKQFSELQQRYDHLEKKLSQQTEKCQSQQLQLDNHLGNFIGLQTLIMASVCTADIKQLAAAFHSEMEDVMATLLAESTLSQQTLNGYQHFGENLLQELKERYQQVAGKH